MSSDFLDRLSENDKHQIKSKIVRTTLEKFERAKILEVYFTRLDNRVPEMIPVEFEDLYAIDLADIKNFLLGQHPQDPILQKIFRMMS